MDRAITRCPQLLGCSSTRTMQPIVWRLNKLGVKSKRLGRVIAYSPQLLLQTPEELNKVRFFKFWTLVAWEILYQGGFVATLHGKLTDSQFVVDSLRTVAAISMPGFLR